MKRNKLLLLFLLPIVLSCSYSTETYKEGKLLYSSKCAGCHGEDFKGLGSLYPSLNDLEYIHSNKNKISCWIHLGIGTGNKNQITRHGDLPMPAIPTLSSIEITNILNYINASIWHMAPFSIQDVTSQLNACQ